MYVCLRLHARRSHGVDDVVIGSAAVQLLCDGIDDPRPLHRWSAAAAVLFSHGAAVTVAPRLHAHATSAVVQLHSESSGSDAALTPRDSLYIRVPSQLQRAVIRDVVVTVQAGSMAGVRGDDVTVDVQVWGCGHFMSVPSVSLSRIYGVTRWWRYKSGPDGSATTAGAGAGTVGSGVGAGTVADHAHSIHLGCDEVRSLSLFDWPAHSGIVMGTWIRVQCHSNSGAAVRVLDVRMDVYPQCVDGVDAAVAADGVGVVPQLTSHVFDSHSR